MDPGSAPHRFALRRIRGTHPVTRDPIASLALDRAALISADIEEQLTARKEHGMRPLIAVLHKARLEAADAMAQLVDADARRADVVQGLQNRIARFADLVRWLKEIVNEGLDQQYEVGDAERDDLESLVAPPDDDASAQAQAERARLGV
jgi:hypothetical protein